MVGGGSVAIAIDDGKALDPARNQYGLPLPP